MNPFSLAGKKALVTGGTRGIGAACAILLARAGADVCVGYRSRHEEAAKLRDELNALGVKGASLAADLGTAAGANALVDHTVKELGGIDIMIHSAGIWPEEEAAVAEMSDDRWARTMRENVDATFYISRAAVRAMLARTPSRAGGRIILIDSTAGQRGEAMHADYAASKGAVIAFVKSFAVEVALAGITVNAVAPGWVDTEMCELPFRDGGKERIAKGIPVGRIASPFDIAFPTVSLCFDGARHVTGEILNVNGGAVLCG
jgi:3-oxoacyl-[acyl-carrier protein] reductase